MKNTRQAQKIYGFPDGYPNKVHFTVQWADKEQKKAQWFWIVTHQGRLIARGTRGYSSKSGCKRAFLSMLTHSFQMQN